MTKFATFLASILTLLLAAASITAGAQSPARFDLLVRTDFFAGFAGDQARRDKGMDACERALAENPKHAEALVWHGSGLAFRAGAAFRAGDSQTGIELWTRGSSEMDTAAALAPDNVGVLIPRGAMLMQATRSMAPAMATPLLQKAVGDYEHALALQTASGRFATLGDHPKGELLFGLAEAYTRLGQPEKARAYFEQLTKDAPGSGQTPKAREWLATGILPTGAGLGCVGCHK
jgi:tetratricopeptide (TPR) repeat protein